MARKPAATQDNNQLSSLPTTQSGPSSLPEHSAASSATGGRKRLGRGLSSLMAKPVQVLVSDEVLTDHTITARPSILTPLQRQTDSEVSQNPEATRNDLNSSNSSPESSRRSVDTIQDGVREDGQHIEMLKVGDISPNPFQPRKAMDQERLNVLAQSIRSAGVMQPVLVRKCSPAAGAGGSRKRGGYELIAGERRWRAATMAGLATIPAIICDLDDAQSAEWALVENLQREDLDPIERAQAFQMLIDQFGLTQSQIAERVGLDRSSVANTLRLNHLDEATQIDIRGGRISQGHAKVLLSIADPKIRRLLAERTMAQGWSVRTLETQAESLSSDTPDSPPLSGVNSLQNRTGKPDHVLALEEQISQSLGLPCRIINHADRRSGKILLTFHSIEQFETFMQRLN